MVAEIHTEGKKSQKTKVKPTTEGRKQLSSVRVIQRNLVYIVGLPLELTDEDVASPSISLYVYLCVGIFLYIWHIRSSLTCLFVFSIFIFMDS